ncbi:cation diffusion facilitator family transporter [Paracoccus sp. p4-l81]|uniref:cation diffusion facilitator family transporter n=1 Tax=unclassified Paracoccus (in: a-proteobacteria) TaxID=2688777 RepID=UPI0035B9BE43
MQAGHARLNLSAGLASVAVALLLVGLKLYAVIQTGALSVAASLTDSAMDLLVSAGGLVAIIYAMRPADDDHRFGHAAAEDLAALFQALVVTGAGLWIGWLAIGRLSGPAMPGLQATGTGLWVMAVSAVLTLGLVIWQARVAARTGNRVVAADRLHYIGDLGPTLGAMAALALAAPRLDAVIALLAAAWMIGGAIVIGRAAWDALMDREADAATLAGITAILDGWPGVHGWHDLHTRTSGSRLFVHVHIELDGDQPLRDAHEIGRALRAAILAAHPGAYVLIHKDVAGRP